MKLSIRSTTVYAESYCTAYCNYSIGINTTLSYHTDLYTEKYTLARIAVTNANPRSNLIAISRRYTHQSPYYKFPLVTVTYTVSHRIRNTGWPIKKRPELSHGIMQQRNQNESTE